MKALIMGEEVNSRASLVFDKLEFGLIQFNLVSLMEKLREDQWRIT